MMSSVSLLQEGKRINRSLSGGVLYVSKLEVMELLAQLANSFGSDELQVLEAIDVYVERSAKFTSGRVILCADVFWGCVEDIVKGETELDRAGADDGIFADRDRIPVFRNHCSDFCLCKRYKRGKQLYYAGLYADSGFGDCDNVYDA